MLRILRGRSVLARRAFTTTANRNRFITIRLTKSAFKKLVRTKRQKVTVALSTRGSDGKLRRATARVTIVAPKAKKAKKKQ